MMTETETTKIFTREEVAQNNSADSLWTIVDHRVYDLTDFQDAHPGGSVVLQQVAGQDATEVSSFRPPNSERPHSRWTCPTPSCAHRVNYLQKAFYSLHRHEVIEQYGPKLSLGTITNETPEVHNPSLGSLSPVPHAEPLWLTTHYKSPYFNNTHHTLRRELRKFVDTYVKPEAEQKEKDGTYISQELINRMAETNILAMRLGPGKHLYGRELLGGAMKGEEFDYFHDLVVAQELARANSRGFQDGNMAGLMISLTAVRQFANDAALKERVTQECLSGKKSMALAITEAFAGSDVAGIRTTAHKSDDGSEYIINGTKKWITNGMWCDYFVVGCRTDKGFSVILVPRSEGVETTPIKTSYSLAAGTAYIEFNDVHVPTSHLLGKEHAGFAVIMSNFNHERFAMSCSVVRWLRTITEECLKWTHQRLIAGNRKLISQQVIRSKLARMIQLSEASQAWLEQVALQMQQLSHDPTLQSKMLGGTIALLKSFATRSAHEVADDATNIFGGRGLTQSGMGKVVEQFHRTYKFDAILGGTEEVLSDLGVRQASKLMPKAML